LHTISSGLSDRILRQLIDESVDAVVVIDMRGHIRYANAALTTLTGHAVEELLGRPFSALLPDEVAAHHDGYVRNYLRSDRPSTILGQVREFRVRHRGGELIPVELKAVDLGVESGERLFGGFMVDLRPRKRLEDQTAALLEQLQQQALSDPLTGLPNRRAFANEAERMLKEGRRSGQHIAIGVADVDYFKQVNDRFGHQTGDLVLRQVAHALQKVLRAVDFIARIGGEEFGLLFREADAEQARQAAERLRAEVERRKIVLPGGQSFDITLSIGVAQAAPQDSLEDVLREADLALYRAKQNGRNRVEAAPGPAAL